MKTKIKRYNNIVNPYSTCEEYLTEVEGEILPRKKKNINPTSLSVLHSSVVVEN